MLWTYFSSYFSSIATQRLCASTTGPKLFRLQCTNHRSTKQVHTNYRGSDSPQQSGYRESLNSTSRTIFLNRRRFSSMTEARVVINYWLEKYATFGRLPRCTRMSSCMHFTKMHPRRYQPTTGHPDIQSGSNISSLPTLKAKLFKIDIVYFAKEWVWLMQMAILKNANLSRV